MKPYALIFLLFVAAIPSWSQGNPSKETAKAMVEGFYQWYIPIATKENREPATDIAINKRASLFSSALIKALREDLEASKKSPGEIVGLDWDPFLASQDPRRKYALGEIAEENGQFLVGIHELRAGKQRPKPSITAIVINEGGHLVFADFISPDGRSLLASLAMLKKDRETPTK